MVNCVRPRVGETRAARIVRRRTRASVYLGNFESEPGLAGVCDDIAEPVEWPPRPVFTQSKPVLAIVMRMARRVETIVTMTDDLDGSKAERTILFAVDGSYYEIDLSRKNANAFDKVLAPYVGVARKVKPTRRRGPGTTPTRGRRDLPQIRQWAQKRGYAVGDRGRIPADVIDAFDAAH